MAEERPNNDTRDLRSLIDASPDDFKSVNHNPTDYENFVAFKNELDNRYEEIIEKKKREDRATRIRDWMNSLGRPWSEAKIKTFYDRDAAKDTTEIIRKRGFSSFYIEGRGSSGKTFLALGIARFYIYQGYIASYQVKHIGEREFLSIARSGFRYDQNLKELISGKKLFIIDDVGEIRNYRDDEVNLWSAFFEWVSRNNVVVILTSSVSPRTFADNFSVGTQSKISRLFGDSTVSITKIYKESKLSEHSQLEDERGEDAAKSIDIFYEAAAKSMKDKKKP